jgi:hypothetical protein
MTGRSAENSRRRLKPGELVAGAFGFAGHLLAS